MVIHYLQPKIKREENLRQFVSDKDFSKLSNANMLMRLMNLEEKATTIIRNKLIGGHNAEKND